MATVSDRYAGINDPDPERARSYMCKTKIGYVSAANARRVIKDMSRKKNVNQLDVYKCSFCAFWHIGNRQQKRKKRRSSNDRPGSVRPSI